MPVLGFLRRRSALVVLALCAFAWAVARACLQSIVIDEADSYLLFGTGDWSGAWFPSSGNHVLNTILFRLAIAAFGLHEWTLRFPAILGASLYIGSSVYLCARLTRSVWLQATLFVCLVFNPFVLDYLVAARGYSLAIGLLLAAIALLSNETPRCAMASAFLGLSFCANFSFAIVDAVTMLLFFCMISRKRPYACFTPGIALALALCGWTLYRYPKGELHFGNTSLLEVWQGLAAASFYELNRSVFPAKLETFLGFIPLILPALAVTMALLLLASVLRNRKRAEPETMALWLAAVVIATLALHWVAFHALHILLPKDRTGLFFVPLFTLSLGAAATARPKDVARFSTVVIMAVAAVYFLACLRLTYFKEWKYNADSRNLYWVVSDLDIRCGVKDAFVEWFYAGPLNFYRAVNRNSSIPEFRAGFPPFPRTSNAYVYWYFDGVVFVRQQGLRVIYWNPETLANIAIRSCEASK